MKNIFTLLDLNNLNVCGEIIKIAAIKKGKVKKVKIKSEFKPKKIKIKIWVLFIFDLNKDKYIKYGDMAIPKPLWVAMFNVANKHDAKQQKKILLVNFFAKIKNAMYDVNLTNMSVSQ